ncbi:MAG TPA: lipopolysaccharide kinase InaA family protein, partial [Thermoguttaceae bacterium]|nr:lipopolysaccharide kinase InaA family protein [Thermoguttaceae bacterium]
MDIRKCSWTQRQEGRFQWHLLSEWESVLLGSLERPIDRWRRLYQVECVKEGSHRAVYRVETPQGVFYAKHYRSPRWTDLWRNLFRGCPARREFETLLALAQRGIPTLRPIAWGRPGGWRGLGDSLLLTEALPNAMALDQFFQQWLAQADQPRLLRILLEELAHFLAKCHQAGVLHQDLHTGNLFVEVEENFCQPETFRPGLVHFFLIDVQAVRLQGALDRQRSLQNLSLLAGAWRERTT